VHLQADPTALGEVGAVGRQVEVGDLLPVHPRLHERGAAHRAHAHPVPLPLPVVGGTVGVVLEEAVGVDAADLAARTVVEGHLQPLLVGAARQHPQEHPGVERVIHLHLELQVEAVEVAVGVDQAAAAVRGGAADQAAVLHGPPCRTVVAPADRGPAGEGRAVEQRDRILGEGEDEHAAERHGRRR
jgi:hypothetical protein